MSYELRLSDDAERDLARVPLFLLNFVESRLHRLAANPVTLSRPSVFPFRPGFQMFFFRFDDPGGDAHNFNALFRYSADETAIIVSSIGYWPTTSD